MLSWSFIYGHCCHLSFCSSFSRFPQCIFKYHKQISEVSGGCIFSLDPDSEVNRHTVHFFHLSQRTRCWHPPAPACGHQTLPPVPGIPKLPFLLLVRFGFRIFRKMYMFCLDVATFPVQITGGGHKSVEVTQGLWRSRGLNNERDNLLS